MRSVVVAVLILGNACVVDEPFDDENLATDEGAIVVGWSTPVRIASVSRLGSYDGDPAVSGDGLELFFISDRDGARRIYMAARATTTEAWGPPIPVTDLWGIAGTNDSGPDLSHDGLTIWFSRAQIGQPGPAIYTATRPIRSIAWTAPVRVTELDGGPATSPHVSRDGLKLYLTSTDPANQDIYAATRSTVTAAWNAPAPVNRFNSTGFDGGVTTSGPDRVAYFESTRGGALRLYRSTRSAETGWSTPVVVEDLVGVSTADLGPDGRYIVMTISANGGDPDIYEASR